MARMRLKPLGVIVLAGFFFSLGVFLTVIFMTMRVENMVTTYRFDNLQTQLPKTIAEYEPIFEKEIHTTVQEANSLIAELRDVEPSTIYFTDYAVQYKNSGYLTGQSMIDETDFAATFGGAAKFSGNDNHNTHFIGHIDEQFKDIQNEQYIFVTDTEGEVFAYEVYAVYTTEDNGVEVTTRTDRLKQIVSKGDTERITLQTCITDNLNWIVEAVRIN